MISAIMTLETPEAMIWLLNALGMVASKMVDLLSELSQKLDILQAPAKLES